MLGMAANCVYMERNHTGVALRERSCAMEESEYSPTTIGNRYAGYTVCDRTGQKIGEVEEIFLDHERRPEYIGVKSGSLEHGPTFVPIDMAQVYEQRRLVKIPASQEGIRNALSPADGSKTMPAGEQQMRGFFGVTDEILGVPPVDWMASFLLVCLQKGKCDDRELAQRAIDSGFEASSPQAVRRALRRMEREGVLVISGNDEAGRGAYPRRRRYAITELGDAYLEYLASTLVQYGQEIDLFFRLFEEEQTATVLRSERNELPDYRKETAKDARARH
jgi:DNA-binding PadR family transcriptional regulator